MRIISVTNLYPPFYLGGYELACHDVTESLRSRGHDTCVVTSTFGVKRTQVDGHIHRILKLNINLESGHLSTQTRNLLKTEWTHQRALQRLTRDFKPDVAIFWNMRGLSLSTVAVLQAAGVPVCFYVSDNWLAAWSGDTDPWFSLWSRTPQFAISRALKPCFDRTLQQYGIQTRSINLTSCHFAFTSHHMQQATVGSGKTLLHSTVIHHGIDPTSFDCHVKRPHGARRLLFVGRLVPDKGVHTAIEAVRILRDEFGHDMSVLDIVGTSSDEEYLKCLQRMIQDSRLVGKVRFLGFVQRANLPTIYSEHDILIFPSIWDEPFSITLLEAMSSGLAVVGTTSGGSGEIMVDEENCLVFQQENADTCARQINRLMSDRGLYDRLCVNARRTIENSFTFEAMVDKVEQLLNTAVTEFSH